MNLKRQQHSESCLNLNQTWENLSIDRMKYLDQFTINNSIFCSDFTAFVLDYQSLRHVLQVKHVYY